MIIPCVKCVLFDQFFEVIKCIMKTMFNYTQIVGVVLFLVSLASNILENNSKIAVKVKYRQKLITSRGHHKFITSPIHTI